MRILILGGPRTGKTTLSEKLGAILAVTPRHTDDLKGLEWSQASEEASGWIDGKGPWVIEGTAAVRAVRKWLRRSPDNAKPCDLVVYLTEIHEPLNGGQAAMAKGVATIFSEILPELRARGINITSRAPESLGAWTTESQQPIS